MDFTVDYSDTTYGGLVSSLSVVLLAGLLAKRTNGVGHWTLPCAQPSLATVARPSLSPSLRLFLSLRPFDTL